MTLQRTIESLFEQGSQAPREAARSAFFALRDELSAGRVRAAEPDSASPTGWRVNIWVKQGILLGFRFGDLADMGIGRGRWSFFDQDTLPLKQLDASSGVRIAPGGSSIREGAHVAPGVTCMPPMYVNIGACIGEGTLVDSHALVGSCAQVGKRVHINAAVQLGGVIEPIGAMPVVIEDEVLLGGSAAIYDGAIVKRRAVLAPGVVLTGSTAVYDLPHERIITPGPGQPLVIPEGAIVVPGARAVTVGAGREWGLSLAVPVIVSYRDETADGRVELERWVR